MELLEVLPVVRHYKTARCDGIRKLLGIRLTQYYSFQRRENIDTLGAEHSGELHWHILVQIQPAVESGQIIRHLLQLLPALGSRESTRLPPPGGPDRSSSHPGSPPWSGRGIPRPAH